MKKKTALISLMIVLCIGLIAGAKGLQAHFAPGSRSTETSIKAASDKDISNNTEAVSEVNNPKVQSGKDEAKPAANAAPGSGAVNPNSDTKNTTTIKNSNSNTSANTTAPLPQSKAAGGNSNSQKPNFIVRNEVTGTVIFSVYFDFNEDTVGNITIDIFDKNNISYRPSGSGDTLYFSSIAGIRERSAGSTSGWCYYVNGVKASVGAGSFTVHKGDIIEWKFVKDGLS